MSRPLATFVLLLSAAPASAQQGKVDPPMLPAGKTAEALIKSHDKNGDKRLNADECPGPFRPAFGRLDTDHDGYLDEGELALGLPGAKAGPARRGEVVANYVYVVADDFVVEVWHNGEKVPDSRRAMLDEVYGAVVEKVDVEVREGDWLVFHVVNNRLRWGGCRYFAAAGMKTGVGVSFASSTATERWSYCDEPGQVPSFLADSAYLARQAALPIEAKWDQGDGRMNSLTDGWKGTAVWGKARSTWIKYVAPSPSGPKD